MALVSARDFPFVSGAITKERTQPNTTRPAATSMVGPMPYASKKIGVAYVARMVPTRLNAMAMPTADARTSVGNSS